MDEVITEKNIGNEYYYKIRSVKKLRLKLYIRLLFLKILYILFLIYIVCIPCYYSYLKLFNDSFIDNSVYTFLVLESVFFLLCIAMLIAIYYIVQGTRLFRIVFFSLGFYFLALSTTDSPLWILQFVCLIAIYKLPELLMSLQITFNNYESYKEHFFELERLKIVVDAALKRHILLFFLLLMGSYLLLMTFSLFDIQIGTDASIVISVVILSLLSPFLFYSKENLFPFTKNTNPQKKSI